MYAPAFSGKQSPFGNSTTPGRYSQHLLATANTGADHGNGTSYFGDSGPGQESGTVFSLFAAFACDSGISNQPPVFVDGRQSNNMAVATDARCYTNEPCELFVHARDFAVNGNGIENGLETSDLVAIELAAGVASDQGTLRDTDIKHPTGSLCQGVGGVSCVVTLTKLGDVGDTVVRCMVAVDLHPESAAPQKRTCRSMPLCIKIHFVSASSADGLIMALGMPNVSFIASVVPHQEHLLRVGWKMGHTFWGKSSIYKPGNVTVEYLQGDAVVPHSIPGLSWDYSAGEARVPFSALRALVPSGVQGVRMRFRVVSGGRQGGAGPESYFFGPWSEWATFWVGTDIMLNWGGFNTGIAFAVSWESNLVHLWQLNRRFNGPASEYAATLVGKYESYALQHGAMAVDSTQNLVILVVSSPNQDDFYEIVTVKIPRGDVLRRAKVYISSGVIWNAHYDIANNNLVATWQNDHESRLISIDVDQGTVTTLTLVEPVVFGISAFDQWSRRYFFLDSTSQHIHMHSFDTVGANVSLDLSGTESGRVVVAMDIEPSSGFLMALMCEWPHEDSSRVYLVRHDANTNLRVSELQTALMGKHVRFAAIMFDFNRMDCVVSQHDGRLLVYNFLSNTTSEGLMSGVTLGGDGGIRLVGLAVYHERAPFISAIIPSEISTDTPSQITIVGSNFGISGADGIYGLPKYEPQVYLDSYQCPLKPGVRGAEVICTASHILIGHTISSVAVQVGERTGSRWCGCEEDPSFDVGYGRCTSYQQGGLNQGWCHRHGACSVCSCSCAQECNGTHVQGSGLQWRPKTGSTNASACPIRYRESWTHIYGNFSHTLQSVLEGGVQITVFGRGFGFEGSGNYRLLLTANGQGVMSSPAVTGSLTKDGTRMVFDTPVWPYSAAECQVQLVHDITIGYSLGPPPLAQFVNRHADADVSSGMGAMTYTFAESWSAIQPSEGFASSEVRITIWGLGFDPAGDHYECEFSDHNTHVAAQVLSYRELQCVLPLWSQSSEIITRLYLRNEGHRLKRYSADNHADANECALFKVKQTADFISPTSSSVVGGTSVSILGHGFDADQVYVCVFYGDSSSSTPDGVQGQQKQAAFVTTTSLQCESPAMNEQSLGSVQVIASDSINQQTLGTFDFDFSPGLIQNISNPSTADSSGGTAVTVYAQGIFRANTSYVCIFNSSDTTVLSDHVTASSFDSISCKTPMWPDAAGRVELRVWTWSGDDMVNVPVVLPFEFTQLLVRFGGPTLVQAGADVNYVFFGYGFVRSSDKYVCRLRDVDRGLEQAVRVSPVNDTTIMCLIAWENPAENLQIRLLIDNEVPSLSYDAKLWTVTVEQVSRAVTPTSMIGNGGLNITVVGAGFDSELSQYSCSVTMHAVSVQAEVISIMNHTHLVCRVPGWTGPSGTAEIVLKHNDSVIMPNAGTFAISIVGIVTDVQPSSGLAVGGRNVTFSGYGFHENLLVRARFANVANPNFSIASVPCSVSNAMRVVCVTPAWPHSQTHVFVTLEENETAVAGLRDFIFQFNQTMVSITPVVAWAAAPARIIVKGRGFQITGGYFECRFGSNDTQVESGLFLPTSMKRHRRSISSHGFALNDTHLWCNSPEWPYESGSFAFTLSFENKSLPLRPNSFDEAPSCDAGCGEKFSFTPELLSMHPRIGLVGQSTVTIIGEQSAIRICFISVIA